MKRKFFSVAVAACMALFTLSGLTCCGGGGGSNGVLGGEDDPAYLTYDGFSKKFRGILLQDGSIYLRIKPYSQFTEGTVNDPKKAWVTLSAKREIATGVLATYEIISYQDAGNINLPVGTLPYTAKMTLSLGTFPDTIKNEVLAAVGLGTTGGGSTALMSSIVIDLTFDGAGGGHSVITVMGKNDAQEDAIITDPNDLTKPISSDGPFVIIQ